MPIGYLVTTTLVALCTVFAVSPPRPRRSSASNRSFWLGFLVNELPFVAFYWLLASTALAVGQGDIDSPIGWVAFGLAVLSTFGLAVVAWRGYCAHTAVDRALNEGLGSEWRTPARRRVGRSAAPPPPVCQDPVRAVLLPSSRRRAGVEHPLRRRGEAKSARSVPPSLASVRRSDARPSARRSVRDGQEEPRGASSPLSAREPGLGVHQRELPLGPGARFPDHLIDVKKVIAWVREHGHEYGADPTVLFVAGSSAGGHLASLAALTPDNAAFQPGFEQADTSVTAAISLYGYYGSLATNEPPSSPTSYVGAQAPPFFVAHGDRDTVVLAEDARRFVERMRSFSSRPVVYAELPGGQHVFDLFHSIRFETVVDAIEAFAVWVRSHEAQKVELDAL